MIMRKTRQLDLAKNLVHHGYVQAGLVFAGSELTGQCASALMRLFQLDKLPMGFSWFLKSFA
jgi:hypothetical protein